MRQLKITKQITGRESYSIEKYLQEIGKIHVLSPEEEADLAKKIRSGDRAAREKLVLSTAFSFKKYCSSLVIVVKMLIFVHSDAEAPP